MNLMIPLLCFICTTGVANPTVDPNLSVKTSLDLKAVQRMALDNSPSLEAMLANVAQAEHQLSQARAAYWPELSAQAAAEHQDYSDREFDYRYLLTGWRDKTMQTYDLSLVATWTLFDGFQRKYAVQNARLNHQASEARLADARRQLLEAVARTYYLGQLAQENIRVAQADLNFQQRLLQEATAQRQAGTGSVTDENNFRIRMNAAQANLLEQQADAQGARVTLGALMGIDPGDMLGHYSLHPMDMNIPSPSLPGIEQECLYARDHRPDLRRDAVAVNQAQASLGLARSRYWPQLVLSGGVLGERLDNAHFDHGDFGYAVGLSLAYPLFDGGARDARVREVQALRRQARSQVRQRRLDVLAEVREALIALTTAHQQVPLQQDNTRLAREVRDQVEKAYRAGETSLVRLNEVQRDLIEAEATLALRHVQLSLAWEQLHAATGRNIVRCQH